MPAGLGPFRRKWIETGDYERNVRMALEHIWQHLESLPGTTAVEVDESGGPADLSFSDGGSPPGDGGGGGTDPGVTHTLLDGDRHEDTAEATAVAGDLVYGNATALWDRLAKGSDGQLLTMVSGAPAWAAAPSGGSSRSLIGSFSRGDISGIGTSDTELYATHTKGANDLLPVIGPAGTITDVYVVLSGDVGGVGNDFTVTVYLNGVATAITATITGGAGTEYKAHGSGSVAFVDEDEITVYGRETGSCDARLVTAFVFGTYG